MREVVTWMSSGENRIPGPSFEEADKRYRRYRSLVSLLSELEGLVRLLHRISSVSKGKLGPTTLVRAKTKMNDISTVPPFSSRYCLFVVEEELRLSEVLNLYTCSLDVET